MEETLEQLKTCLRSFSKEYEGRNTVCDKCGLSKILLYDASYGADYDICAALSTMCEIFDI